jgi:hypothetical protein
MLSALCRHLLSDLLFPFVLGSLPNCEKRLMALSYMLVCIYICMSAWDNSAPTERTLIFDIFRNRDEKIQVSLKSAKNNGCNTRTPKGMYDLLNSS